MNLRSITRCLMCIAVLTTAVTTASAQQLGMTVHREETNGLVATLSKSAAAAPGAAGAMTFQYQLQCVDDRKPCFSFSGPTTDAPDCRVTNSSDVHLGSANCPAAGVTSIALILKAPGAITITKGSYSGECSPVPVTVELRHDNVGAQLNDGCRERVICGLGYNPVTVSIQVDASDDVGASCRRYFITRSRD